MLQREGRQNGTVRTGPVYPSNPPVLNRFINHPNPPPIVGTFTHVPPKPTGDSKPTGRCGIIQCRRRSSGKSQDKVKGSHKWRWHDAVSNHGVAARWAEEGGRRPGFYSGCYGVSAAGVLEGLANDVGCDDGDYLDNDQDDRLDYGF